MKKFQVEIQVTKDYEATVEAETELEAQHIAMDLYAKDEIQRVNGQAQVAVFEIKDGFLREIPKVQCPNCEGAKTVPVDMRWNSGKWEDVFGWCSTCEGTGVIETEGGNTHD